MYSIDCIGRVEHCLIFKEKTYLNKLSTVSSHKFINCMLSYFEGMICVNICVIINDQLIVTCFMRCSNYIRKHKVPSMFKNKRNNYCQELACCVCFIKARDLVYGIALHYNKNLPSSESFATHNKFIGIRKHGAKLRLLLLADYSFFNQKLFLKIQQETSPAYPARKSSELLQESLGWKKH